MVQRAIGAAPANPGKDQPVHSKNMTESDDSPVTHGTRTQHLTHVRELDGLRGVAALMVFAHHLWYTSYLRSGNTPLVEFFRGISTQGRTGVDIFFVLSGFLITSLLIKAKHTSRYYQDFYWKRGLRVLPLYFVCLLGVALFTHGRMTGVVFAAFFLANLAQVLQIATAGPFWTLAIEEQFYIAWPTVVRRRSITELQHWAVAIAVSAFVLRLVAAWFGHYNYAITFLRCDGLAFGAMFGCWFMQGGERLGSKPSERRALVGAFLLGLAFLVLYGAIAGVSARSQAYQGACFQTGVTLLAVALVGTLITYRDAPFLAIFRSRALTFFGLISYAVYMLHGYVVQVWDHVAGEPDGTRDGAFLIRTISIFAISIGLALVSRYLIELPSLSLRRYVLPPKA